MVLILVGSELLPLFQGTVDSGHLCLSGYNEVVMLRRLMERHKCHAIQLLTGTSDSHSTLYGLPHRDGLVCLLLFLNVPLFDS